LRWRALPLRRPFPAEPRRRAVARVPASKPIATAAVELGVSRSAIHKTASILSGEARPSHQGVHPLIDALVETGHRAKLCCQLFGGGRSGYYRCRKRPISPKQLRCQ